MWRRVLAIPVLLLGILVLAGVAYKVFQLSQGQLDGRAGGGVFFGIALVVVGVRWLKGETAE
jgi:hypothetical protein